jgi:hypothetical protein
VLWSFATVSPDGRYYAVGQRLDDSFQRFGILLVDLKAGTHRVLDEDPYIINPHPQFEPGDGRHILRPHHRGGQFGTDGRKARTAGPEGSTLYLLSVEDGVRTPLPVGKPYTTMITGHQVWIGTTREILLSVAAQDDFAAEKGNLLRIRPGQPAQAVGKGYVFNHVNVSRCGRYFCCDDWRDKTKLVIGSLRTGRKVEVCESGASRSREPNTHPHAYLTPDLTWVIFNSDRTGEPHVYAARVPGPLIKQLDA